MQPADAARIERRGDRRAEVGEVPVPVVGGVPALGGSGTRSSRPAKRYSWLPMTGCVSRRSGRPAPRRRVEGVEVRELATLVLDVAERQDTGVERRGVDLRRRMSAVCVLTAAVPPSSSRRTTWSPEAAIDRVRRARARTAHTSPPRGRQPHRAAACHGFACRLAHPVHVRSVALHSHRWVARCRPASAAPAAHGSGHRVASTRSGARSTHQRPPERPGPGRLRPATRRRRGDGGSAGRGGAKARGRLDGRHEAARRRAGAAAAVAGRPATDTPARSPRPRIASVSAACGAARLAGIRRTSQLLVAPRRYRRSSGCLGDQAARNRPDGLPDPLLAGSSGAAARRRRPA